MENSIEYSMYRDSFTLGIFRSDERCVRACVHASSYGLFRKEKLKTKDVKMWCFHYFVLYLLTLFLSLVIQSMLPFF